MGIIVIFVNSRNGVWHLLDACRCFQGQRGSALQQMFGNGGGTMHPAMSAGMHPMMMMGAGMGMGGMGMGCPMGMNPMMMGPMGCNPMGYNPMMGNGVGGWMGNNDDIDDEDLVALQDDPQEGPAPAARAPTAAPSSSLTNAGDPLPSRPLPPPVIQYNKKDTAAITRSASMIRGVGVGRGQNAFTDQALSIDASLNCQEFPCVVCPTPWRSSCQHWRLATQAV